jgi:hypothetical protein
LTRSVNKVYRPLSIWIHEHDTLLPLRNEGVLRQMVNLAKVTEIVESRSNLLQWYVLPKVDERPQSD